MIAAILKKYIRPDALHHAYVLEGQGEVLASLLSFLEQDLNIQIKGNPDLWHEVFDVFGVDEGRNLKEMQQKMSVAGGKKIFILSTRSITHEAQNSLLKVFEEPTEGTHFFIITPSVEAFLPTLRSRVVIVKLPFVGGDNFSDGSAQSAISVSEFIKASPAKRIGLLAPIIEEKDKAAAIVFVDALIKELSKNIQKNAKALETLLVDRGYLSDRSSSVKMILEHISLVI